MKQMKLINSQREVFDLRKKEHLVQNTSLHESEWTYNSIERRFGITIDQFTKKPLELEIDILFSGKNTREKLNEFFDLFEQDVIKNKPSRLVWGDWFIECFVVRSEVHPAEETAGAIKTIKLLAPYPLWAKEKYKTFSANIERATVGKPDYPYNYPYNYTAKIPGRDNWTLGKVSESEFVMKIYGPCNEPEIIINNHVYKVHKEIFSGDCIEIDSRKHTVMYQSANGRTENIFNLRGKKDSVFKKLPTGNFLISWSGNFAFDISAIVERGEPAW